MIHKNILTLLLDGLSVGLFALGAAMRKVWLLCWRNPDLNEIATWVTEGIEFLQAELSPVEIAEALARATYL